MGYCKDCKFWGASDQECNLAEWIEALDALEDDSFGFYADADDDQGLQAGVVTGPLFGCLKFKPLEE